MLNVIRTQNMLLHIQIQPCKLSQRGTILGAEKVIFEMYVIDGVLNECKAVKHHDSFTVAVQRIQSASSAKGDELVLLSFPY